MKKNKKKKATRPDEPGSFLFSAVIAIFINSAGQVERDSSNRKRN